MARGVNVIGWSGGYFTVSTPRIIMAWPGKVQTYGYSPGLTGR